MRAAHCIQQNVDDSVTTYNMMLDIEHRRAIQLAQALHRLCNKLADIPDLQRTIYIERCLVEAEPAWSLADDLLQGEVKLYESRG